MCCKRLAPMRFMPFSYHLLETDTEPVAERRLAHVQHNPAHAHSAADVFVDGIGGFFWHHLNRGRAEGLFSEAKREIISPCGKSYTTYDEAAN